MLQGGLEGPGFCFGVNNPQILFMPKPNPGPYKPPSNGISDTAALFFIVYVGLSSFPSIYIYIYIFKYVWHHYGLYCSHLQSLLFNHICIWTTSY